MDRKARLIRTIEGEIIPRLLVSFAGSLSKAVAPPSEDAAMRLAQLVLAGQQIDPADILRLIDQEGSPRLERACLGLIAPAARRLGEIWERNGCDIEQLLAGLGRLESVIRAVNASACRR